MEMKHRREILVQELLGAVRVLPAAQLREVTDFAGFLHHKHGPPEGERGSANALLRHAGSFQFEPGEMNRILAEVDEMRRMEVEPVD